MELPPPKPVDDGVALPKVADDPKEEDGAEFCPKPAELSLDDWPNPVVEGAPLADAGPPKVGVAPDAVPPVDETAGPPKAVPDAVPPVDEPAGPPKVGVVPDVDPNDGAVLELTAPNLGAVPELGAPRDCVEPLAPNPWTG